MLLCVLACCYVVMCGDVLLCCDDLLCCDCGDVLLCVVMRGYACDMVMRGYVVCCVDVWCDGYALVCCYAL